MNKFWQKTIKKSLAQSAGFSLIEILIALTLMGIAGSFVAGKIFQNLYEGKAKSAKIQMQGLAQRIKEYRRHCSQYPTTDQGLEALVSKPTTGRECKNYQPGGYLDGEVPLDPWDNPYVYTSDGRTFNMVSYGPDGVEGGEGNDKDIYLKDPKGKK